MVKYRLRKPDEEGFPWMGIKRPDVLNREKIERGWKEKYVDNASGQFQRHETEPAKKEETKVNNITPIRKQRRTKPRGNKNNGNKNSGNITPIKNNGSDEKLAEKTAKDLAGWANDMMGNISFFGNNNSSNSSSNGSSNSSNKNGNAGNSAGNISPLNLTTKEKARRFNQYLIQQGRTREQVDPEYNKNRGLWGKVVDFTSRLFDNGEYGASDKEKAEAYDILYRDKISKGDNSNINPEKNVRLAINNGLSNNVNRDVYSNYSLKDFLTNPIGSLSSLLSPKTYKDEGEKLPISGRMNRLIDNRFYKDTNADADINSITLGMMYHPESSIAAQAAMRGILERTPIGANANLMSPKMAYRNTTVDEIENLKKNNIFTQRPGGDKERWVRVGTDKNVITDEEVLNAEGEVLNQRPKGKYTQKGINEYITGDDGKVYLKIRNSENGAKHFNAKTPPEVAGNKIYKRGRKSEEYMIGVEGNSSKWNAGGAGANRKVIQENKPPRTYDEAMNGRYKFGKQAYNKGKDNSAEFNKIPAGRIINLPFNEKGFAYGPNLRDAKVWKKLQNGNYKLIRTPFAQYDRSGFKGLVNRDGSINEDKFVKAVASLKKIYPKSVSANEIKNKGVAGVGGSNIESDLIEHSLAAAKSAMTAPLPKGVTRRDFVEAALMHDLGNIFGRKGHGKAGAWLMRELGIGNKDVWNAVAKHMDIKSNAETNNQLLKALHTADVGRGRSYKDILNLWPYLNY